jgi:hypothetical protein
MVTENGGNERVSQEPFSITKSRLDKLIDSPEIRGARVYQLLENHEMPIWDIVCFCMVFILKASVMLEFLKPIAKELHTVIYLAHYKAPDELGILPKEK